MKYRIFLMQNIPNQWIRRKAKDTKFIIISNSRNHKKVVLNPV